MEVIRRDLAVAVTFCPLPYLGIAVGHCTLTLLHSSNPTELAIKATTQQRYLISLARSIICGAEY